VDQMGQVSPLEGRSSGVATKTFYRKHILHHFRNTGKSTAFPSINISNQVDLIYLQLNLTLVIMKNHLILALLALISGASFGQTFYQDINDADYKNLMKNGLCYVLTGDENIDPIIEAALKDQWKVTPYKIVASAEALQDDDVQIKLLGEEGVPFALNLSIVSVKALNKKGLSLFNTTAFANITGFAGAVDEKSLYYFIPYHISAFNDMATRMNAEQITQKGLPYYNAMNALYIPSAKVLKEKTLLIVENEPAIVNEDELKKAGIKYEFVTFSRFLELESTDAANYCLLYLNPSMYSDITIFNVSDKSIAYTKHYLKNVPKLDKADIKAIVSGWGK
jgi:hypothetical protein